MASKPLRKFTARLARDSKRKYGVDFQYQLTQSSHIHRNRAEKRGDVPAHNTGDSHAIKSNNGRRYSVYVQKMYQSTTPHDDWVPTRHREKTTAAHELGHLVANSFGRRTLFFNNLLANLFELEYIQSRKLPAFESFMQGETTYSHTGTAGSLRALFHYFPWAKDRRAFLIHLTKNPPRTRKAFINALRKYWAKKQQQKRRPKP